ncbi:PD-(D/E)XK motif protein [Alteromonas sp. MMG017]|uniref:PD-(D/E)XK motif protein n=1 Tax=Alteromonas sp. MMG017 TaxID=2822692 RepID=UPI001B3A3B85|nr:PD-(D/E)XK motif protein [Alteromonas sp. MMG017]MBQ4828092.1 PD-(D/E)XK motif protein [Alteromonas sp. MMG017]
MNLSSKWAQLNSALLEGEGLKTLRLSVHCILELFLAIDKDRCRYLILHLPDDFQPSIDYLENENIVLTYSRAQQLIAIKLIDVDFSDLFDDLIESMFNAISKESSIEIASQRLIENFVKWNQFFRKLERKVYSEKKILGIWGELFTLKNLVEKKLKAIEVDKVLEAWTGPLDSVHDFTFSDKSIEIKSKITTQNSINIASEFQLELGAVESLELCIVNVEKDVNGLTIEDLYSKIKENILEKGADLSLFIARLIALKLDERSLKRYGNYSYKALKATYYNCLDEKFPKIVRSKLDDEVFYVKYKIDVSSLNKFILYTERY